MIIFARQSNTNHWTEEIPKVIGFTGTAVAVINIFMTNMIIVSKSVSRECRAFFLGIAFAFGALGAYLSLTLCEMLRQSVNFEAVFVVEILLCVLFIILFYTVAKRDKFFIRKMARKPRNGRSRLRSTKATAEVAQV